MASSQVETVSTTADKAKLGLAVVMVLASLAGFYLLSKQGSVAQWGVLIAGLVAAVEDIVEPARHRSTGHGARRSVATGGAWQR